MNTLILLGDTFLAQGHVRRAEEKYRVALNLNKDSELEKILNNKIKNISK
jgi:predicted negative regulator of RcsB-dependent stress response